MNPVQNEKIKLLIAAVFLIIFFTALFFLSGTNPLQPAQTFEECAEQGNPIMESYPRQCRDGVGNLFVENIGNELEKIDLIRIDTPLPNAIIKSPLTITGEARGYWFFEASFPVVLTDWDGKIIAQHYAEAQTDPALGGAGWMTEEFVPFKATLEFSAEGGSASGGKNPGWDADFSKRGTLILQKDNPSGLPENDPSTTLGAGDALEIPVRFE